jgi:Cu+-exporting ATPase
VRGSGIKAVPRTDNHSEEATMEVRDPVCGMTFDESDAAAMLEYEGTTYHFCAEGCKEAFEEDPDRYREGDDR